MATSRPIDQALLDKLKTLPSDKLAEVEDFVDFLATRQDRELASAFAAVSQPGFAKVWDNPDDAEYDRL